MLAVSPDNKTIAGGGYQEVHIWDLEGAVKLLSFPTYPRVTTGIAFSPDSTSLVVRSYGNISVWSLDGERLATITSVAIGDANDFAGELAVSRSGIIATTRGRAVELCDLSGKRLARWETEEYMSSVAFSEGGDLLAVGSQKGEIKLIDVASTPIISVLKESREYVQQIAWSYDGILAAAARGNVDLWSDHKIGTLVSRVAPCADEDNITERLNRILTKITKRGLKMNPPIEIDEVRAFEAQNRVILPEGFRRFITEIGNGGDGPPAYGLIPLRESVEIYGESLRFDEQFSLTDSCVWESEDEPLRTELLSTAWKGGYLHLGTDGCAMEWVLIVTGEERGHIWQMDGMGATAVEPRRDFLSWYEYWIDGGNDYWGMYENKEGG